MGYDVRMPNRTVYLPAELDDASRRLKLNLSHLVQDAIRELAIERDVEEIEAAVDAASARASALEVDWSDFSLEAARGAARER